MFRKRGTKFGAMNAASNELAVRVNDARVFAVTDARVDLQPR